MDSINKAAEKLTATASPPGLLPPPVGWVTRGERLAQEVKKLSTAEDSAKAFKSLMNQQQKEVIWKLLGLENHYDDIGVAYNRIHNKPRELQVLKMSDSESFLSRSFVDRVLEGREISDSIVPME